MSAATSGSGAGSSPRRTRDVQRRALLDRERVRAHVPRPRRDRAIERLAPRLRRLPGDAAHQVEREARGRDVGEHARRRARRRRVVAAAERAQDLVVEALHAEATRG